MTTPRTREVGRFFSLADAAEILAVDVSMVDALVRSGELPAIRVGSSGPYRIERTQLDLWIEGQYRQSEVDTAWNEGEFANVAELSGANQRHLRAVD
ncbi:helix-turn-helix domain-containing protein [Agromyces sp. MMS24-K17]|uniref:helix-turn-helix domain-containing protein n=1 Tax=Agromyces sp. MMS24-K17 TaxID=3372850 RepID=UPI003754A677